MTDTLFFIDEDEVLAHHGVKGMKWGVRKQRAASGGAGSTKKRKGLSRKQKAAIAGVLGTAAAAGAGYYLHKSGKGKKIAALAKKAGASAKSAAQGKGRNLGAQAKRFAKAQSANAKGAAEKLKTTKAGKYAEATRLAANAAAFKTGNAVKGAGYKAKNQAWKAGNKARKAAEGGVVGVKSAAGAAKSKVGKKTPGKALSTHVVQPGKGVGYRKLATTGTKVMGGKGDAAKKLAKIAVAGVGVQVAGTVAGAAGARALNKKLNGGKKSETSKKRRR